MNGYFEAQFRKQSGIRLKVARQTGSPPIYAEFNIDIGNAPTGVLGFVVHVGELLHGRPTARATRLRKTAKTKAGPVHLPTR